MDKDIYGTLADSRPLMALTQHYLLSAKNTIYIIYRIFLTKYVSEEKKKVAYYENWHEKGIQNTNSLNLKKNI